MEQDPYDKFLLQIVIKIIISIIAVISDVGGWTYASLAPPRRDYPGTTRAGRDWARVYLTSGLG